MKKCYFARPISQYNTLQDARDLDTIRDLGFEVINPNKEELSELYLQKGMQAFTDLINDDSLVDLLIYRSFPDLKISAGVVKEIECAINAQKIVFELPTFTEVRKLSVVATREYLTLLGQR